MNRTSASLYVLVSLGLRIRLTIVPLFWASCFPICPPNPHTFWSFFSSVCMAFSFFFSYIRVPEASSNKDMISAGFILHTWRMTGSKRWLWPYTSIYLRDWGSRLSPHSPPRAPFLLFSPADLVKYTRRKPIFPYLIDAPLHDEEVRIVDIELDWMEEILHLAL